MNIIELAKEAGFGDSFAEVYEQRLERFANLVRAEALAKQFRDATKMISEDMCDESCQYDDGICLKHHYAEPVNPSQLTDASLKPVAWYLDTFDEDGELEDREYNTINEFSCGRGNGTPLYAAPVDAKAIRAEALEEAIAILKGIDQTETESDDGWWQTSTGAEFGAAKLAAIRGLK